MMAQAAGKATGRPGICFVTRGPGATRPSLLRTGRCVVLLKPLWTRTAHVMALWSISIPQDTTEPCPHGPDDHATSPHVLAPSTRASVQQVWAAGRGF